MSEAWNWMRDTDLAVKAWGWNHPVLAVLITLAVLGLAALVNWADRRH